MRKQKQDETGGKGLPTGKEDVSPEWDINLPDWDLYQPEWKLEAQAWGELELGWDNGQAIETKVANAEEGIMPDDEDDEDWEY